MKIIIILAWNYFLRRNREEDEDDEPPDWKFDTVKEPSHVNKHSDISQHQQISVSSNHVSTLPVELPISGFSDINNDMESSVDSSVNGDILSGPETLIETKEEHVCEEAMSLNEKHSLNVIKYSSIHSNYIIIF